MNLIKFAITTASLAFVTPASAALVIFDLQGVTFADGGSASGFITVDDTVPLPPSFFITNFVTDYSISVSGGDVSLFPAFVYTPLNTSDAALYQSTGNFQGVNISFTDFPESSRAFRLNVLATPSQFLSSSSLSLNVNRSGNQECFDCVPQRSIQSGSLIKRSVAPAVPEPTTWMLMLLGMAGVGFSMRRRKRSDASLALA